MSARAAQPGMTEREHHAWGALLKYVEAIATAYRYDRYPKSSKTGKKIERLIAAAQKLREQLAHEYGWVATEHLIRKDDRDNNGHADRWQAYRKARAGDVYFGKELRGLQFYVFDEIENGPPNRVLKALGYDANARALYHHEVREGLMRGVQELVATAHPQLPSVIPQALPAPAQPPATDRHEELREALLEDPDRPQAAFVKLCRVHPNTVRRTRRQLEEAGEIPYLAHRHAA